MAGTNLPQAPQQHGGYHTGAALVHSGGHGLYHGPHAAIGHDGKINIYFEKIYQTSKPDSCF